MTKTTNKNMKTKRANITLQSSITRVVLTTAGLLMIPLIGTQVSTEWDWSPGDFFIMGLLIAGIGTMVEYVRHTIKDDTKRAFFTIGLILLALYIWAELAVGIFTTLGS
jgi:hypothetical protein